MFINNVTVSFTVTASVIVSVSLIVLGRQTNLGSSIEFSRSRARSAREAVLFRGGSAISSSIPFFELE